MKREISIEEIHERLKLLKKEIDQIQEESWDPKKGFRHFKNSLLDLLDDLDYLKENDELLDDDWYGKKIEFEDDKKERKSFINNKIDLDDLMGDDD